MGTEMSLLLFKNAYWVGNVHDWKSTIEYVFLLGSWWITWGSKKQAWTTFCSIKMQHVTMMSASKKTIWLKRLLWNIQININPKLLVDRWSKCYKVVQKFDYSHSIIHHFIRVKAHYLNKKCCHKYFFKTLCLNLNQANI